MFEEHMAAGSDSMAGGAAESVPTTDTAAGGGGAPSSGQSDSDLGDAGEAAPEEVTGVDPGVDDEVEPVDEPFGFNSPRMTQRRWLRHRSLRQERGVISP